jgi:pimeloyl-ACP methyl ester carboxylesterase
MNKARQITVSRGRLGAYLLHRKRREFFDSAGVRLHYSVEGAGEPVILVHGFAVDADLNWTVPGIAEALAKHFRVINLDLRGHGLSDKPHESSAYGLEFLNDILRLMDHLGIAKAHMAGYSMGGFITLKFIAAHPERLISAAPCAAGWERPTEERLTLLRTLVRELRDGKGFGPLIRELDLSENPSKLRMALTNRILCAFTDTQAMAAIMDRFLDFEVTEAQLRANTVPTLSIVGTADPLKAAAAALVGVMANHEILYLNGADHLTATQRLALPEALIRHFRAHGAAAADIATEPAMADESPVDLDTPIFDDGVGMPLVAAAAIADDAVVLHEDLLETTSDVQPEAMPEPALPESGDVMGMSDSAFETAT